LKNNLFSPVQILRMAKVRQPKVKFEVVLEGGKTEPWSGVFTDKQAEKWYAVHGRWWEAQGKTFIKVEVR